MSVSFTPGPWSTPYYDINPGDEGWWIHNGKSGADEYAVAVAFRLNPCGEADARLIAAAPEMYAALKDVAEYFPVAPRPAFVDRLLAVIAKAEGYES